MGKVKRIAALALAAIIASSSIGVTASAADIWYNDGEWNIFDDWWTVNTPSNPSSTDQTSLNSIPRKLYVTNYTSGADKRTERAKNCITKAESYLNQVVDPTQIRTEVDYGFITYGDNDENRLSFDSITLKFGTTNYDDLAKADAEDGSVILTFNSQKNIDSAIKKIVAEEQTLLDSALKPYVTYINTLIKDGSYTKISTEDSTSAKAIKTANEGYMKKALAALTYSYDEYELFNSETDDDSLYQTIHLTFSSTGSTKSAKISNEDDLYDFPRFVIDGNTIEWSDIEYVDITTKANNSWWFALKDGSTLGRAHYNAITRDYYWLKGMMVPNYTPVIAFGADYRDWQPYETVSTSSSGNDDWNDDDDNNNNNGNIKIYYNTRYHYTSEFVYAVTNGTKTIYYPNQDYADAACALGNYRINGTTASKHSKTNLYFCFVNGQYYTSASASPYPNQTALMQMSDESSSNTIKEYYYIHEGNVYDYNGKKLGTIADRGFSSSKTWFNINTGTFYASPVANAVGFYVSTSNTDNVSPFDPYFEYWTAKLEELKKEIEEKLKELEDIEKRIEDAKKQEENNKSTSKTDNTTDNANTGISSYYKTSKSSILYITGAELADIRENYEVAYLKSSNALWTIRGKDVKTAKAANLRILFKTNNIPDNIRLKMAKRDDVAATSKLTIGENVKWRFTASVRIKYKSKYANYRASLYRYDSKTGSLIFVDDATVNSKGYVTFDNINHGGDYLVTFG